MCKLCQDEIMWDLMVCSTTWCQIVVPEFPLGRLSISVAPKRHVASITELTDEELFDLTKTMSQAIGIIKKKINPASFLILSVEGRTVYQENSHLHFLVIARELGDGADGLDDLEYASLTKHSEPISRQELLKIKNMFT